MIRRHRVLMLSVVVSLTGFVVQSAQAREEAKCTGIIGTPVEDCTGDWDQQCYNYLHPLLGCGHPKSTTCGPSGGGGGNLIIFCNYNS